jgi:hypothetical protein
MRSILMMAVLAATMSLGLATGTADTADTADTCPVAPPVPATASDIACITGNSPVFSCGGLTASTCFLLNQTAFNDGLITVDGAQWLLAFDWCPILGDFPGVGTRIVDFCKLEIR